MDSPPTGLTCKRSKRNAHTGMMTVHPTTQESSLFYIQIKIMATQNYLMLVLDAKSIRPKVSSAFLLKSRISV